MKSLNMLTRNSTKKKTRKIGDKRSVTTIMWSFIVFVKYDCREGRGGLIHSTNSLEVGEFLLFQYLPSSAAIPFILGCVRLL